MTYIYFNRNKIRKSKFSQVKSSGDDGGTGGEYGCSEYELQSSTKAGLVLQHGEGSKREKDKDGIGYHSLFIYIIEKGQVRKRNVGESYLSCKK
jgi:hypothetical protein